MKTFTEAIVKGHISKKNYTKIKDIDINSTIIDHFKIGKIELYTLKKIGSNNLYVSEYLNIIQYFFDNYDMSKVKFNVIAFNPLANNSLGIIFLSKKEDGTFLQTNYGMILELDNKTCYLALNGSTIEVKGNEDKIYDLFCE